MRVKLKHHSPHNCLEEDLSKGTFYIYGGGLAVADFGQMGPWFETWPGRRSLWPFASNIYPLLITGKTQEAVDVRLTRTDCDKAGDYVVPHMLCPRDLVSSPKNMDKTALRILFK